MNLRHPFNQADLGELNDCLLARAHSVIAMQEIHAGNRNLDVIAMRHDCDSKHSLATAVHMAEWEANHGYRSTYYILHTSPYWQAPGFREALETIALHGHEIGIHTNALAEALRTTIDPDIILDEAIGTLRSYGFTIRGVAGHGDPFCNRERAEGEITFANDEQFIECARPTEGAPNRVITRGNIRLKLRPRPLADFGLDYEALAVARPASWRVSDSGGRWQHGAHEPTFEQSVAMFDEQLDQPFTARQPSRVPRQLHLLVHPDWWAEAFPATVKAAA